MQSCDINNYEIILQLHYISPNIGTTSGSAQSATSIFGYIGTPPQMRRPASQLVWKQGPCMLVEEALSTATVEKIYSLGPNYVGCLQAVPQGNYFRTTRYTYIQLRLVHAVINWWWFCLYSLIIFELNILCKIETAIYFLFKKTL